MTDISTDATAADDAIGLPVASKGDKAFLRAPITLREETVGVPEWGRSIIVREMTAEENREWQLSNVKWDRGGNPAGMKKQDVDLRLLLRTCIDDHGVRLFTEDDFPLLRKQPAGVVSRLVRVAKRLSGLSDDEDARARDDAEKND